MAEKDQIDHDALAAEWGVALEAEQNPGKQVRSSAERTAANPADDGARNGGAMALTTASSCRPTKAAPNAF